MTATEFRVPRRCRKEKKKQKAPESLTWLAGSILTIRSPKHGTSRVIGVPQVYYNPYKLELAAANQTLAFTTSVG